MAKRSVSGTVVEHRIPKHPHPCSERRCLTLRPSRCARRDARRDPSRACLAGPACSCSTRPALVHAPLSSNMFPTTPSTRSSAPGPDPTRTSPAPMVGTCFVPWPAQPRKSTDAALDMAGTLRPEYRISSHNELLERHGCINNPSNPCNLPSLVPARGAS